MLRRLKKIESHTKFDDLQSEWVNKKRLKQMVSVSRKRLDGSVKQSSNKQVALMAQTSARMSSITGN